MKMPQYVIDRVMNKRGREHVFDAFDPKVTAFMVTDMQNAFVKGKVKADSAIAIMPNINLLAQKLRNMGGHVAWVQLQAGDKNGNSVAEIFLHAAGCRGASQ
jgi:ureidoacrylate peracid hydrolase